MGCSHPGILHFFKSKHHGTQARCQERTVAWQRHRYRCDNRHLGLVLYPIGGTLILGNEADIDLW
jgi:hypothetical protein